VTGEIVAISGIAAGGDGVGRLSDGRAVFVPRTGPGERVRLREGSLHLHRGGRFARGEAAEIVEPATDRVTPACPHYNQDHCGGCQLQHLGYEAQLAAKRAIVGDALRRIGKIDVSDPQIVPARALWRYQAMLSLAVHGSTVGLHPHDRPGRVFPLDECHVAHPTLVELWNDLKGHPELFPERLTRISLRLDRDGVRHVMVESAGEPWLRANRLRESVPPANTIVCWWQPVDGAARVVAGPETGFPPTAFEALHPAVVSDAGQWAMEAVGPVSGETVWDLYGGSGDLGVELALRGATVISVDADEKAIGWARRRPDAARCGERLRFIAGRVEDVLPSLPPPQLVVANPPSTGLHWDVSLRLGGEPVSRLVYLSRHPATLARDLHRLNVNYQVREVRAFDLAPQTAAVLVVAVLEAA
jgi:23S rRNA (uracil1939-C5)-methyltransferase